MKLRTLSFMILFLAASPSVQAGPVDTEVKMVEPQAPIPQGARNDCSGIEIGYKEELESQGFLGLATPSEHDRNIERAIYYNVHLAWHSYHARNMRYNDWTYSKFMAQTPAEIVPDGGVPFLMAYEFRLNELCMQARQRGFKRLTFACDSDLTSNDNVHMNSRGLDDGGTSYFMQTECIISTHPKKNASWKELKKFQLGKSEKRSGDAMGDGSSFGDNFLRRLAYLPLIKALVNGQVTHAIEQAKPAVIKSVGDTDVAQCVLDNANSVPAMPFNFGGKKQ